MKNHICIQPANITKTFYNWNTLETMYCNYIHLSEFNYFLHKFIHISKHMNFCSVHMPKFIVWKSYFRFSKWKCFRQQNYFYSSPKSQKCFKPDSVVRRIAISKKNTTHQNMLCQENWSMHLNMPQTPYLYYFRLDQLKHWLELRSRITWFVSRKCQNSFGQNLKNQILPLCPLLAGPMWSIFNYLYIYLPI